MARCINEPTFLWSERVCALRSSVRSVFEVESRRGNDFSRLGVCNLRRGSSSSDKWQAWNCELASRTERRRRWAPLKLFAFHVLFLRSCQMKLRRGSGSNLLLPSLMEQVGMLISLCACAVCRYMSTVTHDWLQLQTPLTWGSLAAYRCSENSRHWKHTAEKSFLPPESRLGMELLLIAYSNNNENKAGSSSVVRWSCAPATFSCHGDAGWLLKCRVIDRSGSSR